MKLEGYGIKGTLLRWLESFLTRRQQRVAVNGNLSSYASVNSGVPQGSVLGLLLFICYVNNMLEVVHSAVRMLAEDTKIFRQVDSEEEMEDLQSDLKKLKDWADIWQLRFNATQCKVMHLGRNNHCHECVMEHQDSQVKLSVNECEKDLGVNVEGELKFSNQSFQIKQTGNVE